MSYKRIEKSVTMELYEKLKKKTVFYLQSNTILLLLDTNNKNVESPTKWFKKFENIMKYFITYKTCTQQFRKLKSIKFTHEIVIKVQNYHEIFYYIRNMHTVV